jgi:hypothetical protein
MSAAIHNNSLSPWAGATVPAKCRIIKSEQQRRGHREVKKILMAAVALTAFGATPALAQEASFSVSGTVNAQCGAISNGTISFSGALDINAATGALNANQSASSSSQSVYCNGVNSKISVSSTPLDNKSIGAATDTADFTRTINYTPEVDFAGVVVNAGTALSLGAKAGTMVVSAKNLTALGGKRPYAGDYSGTITVSLAPAV